MKNEEERRMKKWMSQGIEKTNKLILLVEMNKVMYYFYLHVSRNNEREGTIWNYDLN